MKQKQREVNSLTCDQCSVRHKAAQQWYPADINKNTSLFGFYLSVCFRTKLSDAAGLFSRVTLFTCSIQRVV